MQAGRQHVASHCSPLSGVQKKTRVKGSRQMCYRCRSTQHRSLYVAQSTRRQSATGNWVPPHQAGKQASRQVANLDGVVCCAGQRLKSVHMHTHCVVVVTNGAAHVNPQLQGQGPASQRTRQAFRRRLQGRCLKTAVLGITRCNMLCWTADHHCSCSHCPANAGR
jgi:hypothetical protein